MSTTAQEVYDIAIALIDSVDGENDDYETKAPSLIDILQRDIAKLEDVTVSTPVTALTQTLVISDDLALRAMPYGLAAKFALADKDAEFYNEYQTEYERQKRETPHDEEDFTDDFDVISGMGTSETEF